MATLPIFAGNLKNDGSPYIGDVFHEMSPGSCDDVLDK